MQTNDRNDPALRKARLQANLRKLGIDPEDREVRKYARADLEREAVKSTQGRP